MTRQRTFIYALPLCFLFFLLPGCDGPAEKAGEKIDETVQKQKGQFEDAEKEIAEAKAEIENLRNELTRARQERDEAKVRLEDAEQERQRALKQMNQPNISESQGNATLELQQNGNELQGQEAPQMENAENGQPPAPDTTLKNPEDTK